MHHAEIRLRGHPPQRQSFRTKTQAKKIFKEVGLTTALWREEAAKLKIK